MWAKRNVNILGAMDGICTAFLNTTAVSVGEGSFDDEGGCSTSIETTCRAGGNDCSGVIACPSVLDIALLITSGGDGAVTVPEASRQGSLGGPSAIDQADGDATADVQDSLPNPDPISLSEGDCQQPAVVISFTATGAGAGGEGFGCRDQSRATAVRTN